MKVRFTSLLVLALFVFVEWNGYCALRLVSGDTSVKAVRSDKKYGLVITYGKQAINFFDKKPVSLVVDGVILSADYSECTKENGALRCVGEVVSANGSKFIVTDVYRPQTDGGIELRRTVNVTEVSVKDTAFNSLFGIDIGDKTDFCRREFFIPAVWYKENFTAVGHIPAGIPQFQDDCFMYRDDRITLPVVMSRNPENGLTLSIIHKGPESHTVMADHKGSRIDAGYQFCSVGVRKQDGRMHMLIAYPGTEEGRRGGIGARSHPVSPDVRHSYVLEMTFANTDGYADAVRRSGTGRSTAMTLRFMRLIQNRSMKD